MSISPLRQDSSRDSLQIRRARRPVLFYNLLNSHIAVCYGLGRIAGNRDLNASALKGDIVNQQPRLPTSLELELGFALRGLPTRSDIRGAPRIKDRRDPPFFIYPKTDTLKCVIEVLPDYLLITIYFSSASVLVSL